ncbi:MAG: BatD family protein [Paludibacteraceae bacterium]|nr:BatD family protein [Paludibacteraceae bacterium]
MYKNLIILLTLLSAPLLALGANVEFTASAPSAVVVGNRFTLSYTVNQESKDFRAPEMTDFNVLMGPSTSHSSSVQIINGSMTKSMSITYTYVLVSDNPGTYTLPGATIVVNGEKYTSNSLTIKVLPADKASEAQQQGQASQGGATLNNADSKTSKAGDNNLFIRQIISKTNVYEQEAFLVTYKLYTRYNIRDIANVKFPEYKGFYVQDIELDENRQFVPEHYNGMNYNAIILKQALLYPQHSGTAEIDKGSLDVVIVERVQGRSQSIFDGFFDSYQDVKKSLTIPSAKIEVKPLPSGAPKSFNGAVGQFDVKSSISTQNVKANDAVTVKLNISGNGNLKLLKSPEVEFPADFDVYDPKVENNVKVTAGGASGSKSIEYLAIPRFGGDFEIKGIEFSWFDPKTGKYKTANTPNYSVKVEGVADNTQVVASSGVSNKESVRNLGSDIRHIHSDNALKMKGEGFYGTAGFAAGYLIPLIVFVLLLIILQKQARENANIALKRTKRASKVAVKRLKSANAFMKKNDKSHFYEETMKALWGYLSDKLSIPQADLTKDNVKDNLSAKGVKDEVITEFLNTLQDCEFARFSSANDENLSMQAIYGRATKLIESLEDKL